LQHLLYLNFEMNNTPRHGSQRSPSSGSPERNLPHALGRSAVEEPLSEQRQIKFKPSMMEGLKAVSRETGLTVAEFVRRAVDEKLRPATYDSDGAMPLGFGGSGYAGRFLGGVPAGPWREALDQAGIFTLSPDMAEELEVREGDLFIRAEGQSMEGAGIPDGAIVLVRPVPDGRLPRSGERVLSEIEDGDGRHWSTIKRWHHGPPVRLEDGDGRPFLLPNNPRRIRPVAVARGIVSRLDGR